MSSRNTFITIASLVLMLLSIFQHSQAINSTIDQNSLLHFKSYITDDPSKILSTWIPTTTFCNWTGITCHSSKQRVISIKLPNFGLVGSLSPHIANLSLLQVLNLQENKLSGVLPMELGQLSKLKELNISVNELEGTIPSSLSQCKTLQTLDLSYNRFEGFIPAELSELPTLETLIFAFNFLIGPIPASFGNTTSLTSLILMRNQLTGSIPVALGYLPNLEAIQFSSNNLTGNIPDSLFNVSSLLYFQATENGLTGNLQSEMFLKMPNLQRVYIGKNDLTGPLPNSLSNASKLEFFDIQNNNFNGRVPCLGNLPQLLRLNLGSNELGSENDEELAFITSLSNSTKLRVFSIANNQFKGRLPSISNFSRYLTYLAIGGNQLKGSLPEDIGSFVYLQLLSIEENLISGKIPISVGNLENLSVLSLYSNALTGSIPNSIGNLTFLSELNLKENSLMGPIPLNLENFTNLQILDLSSNSLNGTIAGGIFTIPSLTNVLNLSHNALSGLLPTEIGKLKSITKIDISTNQLSGPIPSQIGECSGLHTLSLSGNAFQSSIPDSIGNLKGIDSIDLSSNNLSGTIPSSLENLRFLIYLNLSMNQLKGEVPKEGIFANASAIFLAGNPDLCGGVPNLGLLNCNEVSSKSHVTLIIGLSVGVGGVVLFIFLLFILVLVRKRKAHQLPAENTMSFQVLHTLYTYNDLRTATDNFNQNNFLGEGSFGSVYKGVLSNDTVVAIKVFKIAQRGVSKSFIAEYEAMRNIRHRNLVRIISVCASSEFKALVLQYMPNGNLDKWLHERTESDEGKRRLDVRKRLDIAIDIASALAYLHHDCSNPVIHCDLKPSNILIDKDMTAHVGDFGLAKVLLEETINHHFMSTYELKGSFGYIPPEYGIRGGISTKGDVYSFGVLLLELFTRKKPTEEMFIGEMTLMSWVASALPERVLDVLDSHMEVTRQDVRCLTAVMQLALCCAVKSPESRPSMRNVSVMIKAARDELM